MNSPPVVLGIFPNARGFGFALMESPSELLDYGSKTFRPLTNDKCIKGVKNILDYYKPKLILLRNEESKDFRGSKRIKQLLVHLKVIAKNTSVEVKSYSRNEIRFVFSQFKAKTKYEIATTLAKWLPQLKKRLPKPRQLWMPEDHRMGMFDALSLVFTHYYLSEN